MHYKSECYLKKRVSKSKMNLEPNDCRTIICEIRNQKNRSQFNKHLEAHPICF